MELLILSGLAGGLAVSARQVIQHFQFRENQVQVPPGLDHRERDLCGKSQVDEKSEGCESLFDVEERKSE